MCHTLSKNRIVFGFRELLFDIKWMTVSIVLDTLNGKPVIV